MADEDGSTYTVTYLDGAQETVPFLSRGGKAIVSYPSGDTFEGFFDAARLKQGAGVYTWQVVVAEDDDSEESTSAPPAKYEGLYVDGKRSGLGKMRYANGDVYHGEWSAGVREGEGAFTYANSDIYSGTWKAGAREGTGVYLFAGTECQLSGVWVAGRIAQGQLAYDDGSVFVGAFMHNQPFGPGTITAVNGNVQRGAFWQGRYPELGDRVVAGKQGDDYWLHAGKVSSDERADGTFSVLFDDGSTNESVALAKLRAENESTPMYGRLIWKSPAPLA